MKEETLKKKANIILKTNGWEVWFPPNVKWKKQKDIFGIWDGIAWREDQLLFFQLTTMKNKAARGKKIIDYMNKYYLDLPRSVKGQIWAWDKKIKFFRIFNIVETI